MNLRSRHHNLLLKNGMTLVEIILAMAIFSILVLAFMSVFSGVYLGVNRAGSKGQALHQAQEDIESQIGANDAQYTNDVFDLTFSNEEDEDQLIKIYNWRISSEQAVQDVNSRLTTFVPLFSEININPSFMFEGEPVPQISIAGIDTNFLAGPTTVTIHDMYGNDSYSVPTEVITESNAKGIFLIPEEVTLPSGMYIFDVRTDLGDGRTEISRARFTVGLPLISIASTSGLYISANGDLLLKPSEDRIPAGNFSSVSFSGDQFLTVDNDGRTYFQKKYESKWQYHYDLPFSSSVNSIYIPYWSSFFVSGNLSRIYRINNNSNDYTPLSFMSDSDISDITTIYDMDYTVFPDDSINFVAVGNNGSLLYSSDSNVSDGVISVNRIDVDPIELVDLRTVSISNRTNIDNSSDIKLVVGGAFGKIYYSTGNFAEFTSIVIDDDEKRTINRIQHFNHDEMDWFFALGDTGLFMYSNNLIDWMPLSVPAENYRDIFYSTFGSFFVAVGDNKTVLRSNDGLNWMPISLPEELATINFNAVSGQ